MLGANDVTLNTLILHQSTFVALYTIALHDIQSGSYRRAWPFEWRLQRSFQRL